MPDIVTHFQRPLGIEVYTNAVSADEPCYLLVEVNRLNEATDTLCRFQILKVVRDDSVVTACVPLGPAKDYTADGFTVPGGWIDEDGRGEAVHTVAELQEIAQFLRAEPLHRELEPLDLGGAYKDHVIENIKQQNHQTTSGPHITIERH